MAGPSSPEELHPLREQVVLTHPSMVMERAKTIFRKAAARANRIQERGATEETTSEGMPWQDGQAAVCTNNILLQEDYTAVWLHWECTWACAVCAYMCVYAQCKDPVSRSGARVPSDDHPLLSHTWKVLSGSGHGTS